MLVGKDEFEGMKLSLHEVKLRLIADTGRLEFILIIYEEIGI